MPQFSPEDCKILEKYVTSATDNVFAVSGLPGLVGAVYARYSRASGGFRQTLLKEFIKEGNIDAEHAQDLIERVLIAFGDDSVGELEGAHVSFEDISMLVTKEIEDRRIGGSPIEISTRYVSYDIKDSSGHWRYVRPKEIMESPLADRYIQTMDFIFETYASLVEPMQNYYKKIKPIETAEYDILGSGNKQKIADLSQSEDIKAFKRTYKMDIKTKACDTLRYLLPLSTKANMGVFGNGRFFQGLISHCYTADLPETQEVGKKTHQALNSHISRYVKRAKKSEYLSEVRLNMNKLAKQLFANITPSLDGYVDLIDRGEEHILAGINNGQSIKELMQNETDILTLAHMLYPHTNLSLNQIRQTIRKLNQADKNLIIKTYIGNRTSRRDRPGRAMESGYTYTFDLLTDFGTYKDLMRHRMTTQLRQKFTPLLGFAIPEDLQKAGFASKAEDCHRQSVNLYKTLQDEFPEQASYATLHGSKVRWLMGFNDREAYHMLELRTIPQGHASYRKVAQKMHQAIMNQSNWRGSSMKFVDHNDYLWSRADSEAQQRVKEKELINGQKIIN